VEGGIWPCSQRSCTYTGSNPNRALGPRNFALPAGPDSVTPPLRQLSVPLPVFSSSLLRRPEDINSHRRSRLVAWINLQNAIYIIICFAAAGHMHLLSARSASACGPIRADIFSSANVNKSRLQLKYPQISLRVRFRGMRSNIIYKTAREHRFDVCILPG
jgi:hypothetical protein